METFGWLFSKWKVGLILIVVLLTATACQSIGWGTDGSAPILTPAGTGLNVLPQCNTNYDIYLGEVGAFADSPPSNYAILPSTAGGTDSVQNIIAAENSYAAGHGVGAGGYVFLSGPSLGQYLGYSPVAWGQQEADWAMSDLNSANTYLNNNYRKTFSFMFLAGDIEVSSNDSYGWELGNATANYQVWTAFVNTLQENDINVMLYSSPSTWSSYFNNQSVTTVEWTFETSAYYTIPCPYTGTNNNGSGFGGATAQYFDVTSTTNELVWQWSQQGGDFDIINISNYNSLFNSNFNP